MTSKSPKNLVSSQKRRKRGDRGLKKATTSKEPDVISEEDAPNDQWLLKIASKEFITAVGKETFDAKHKLIELA